MACSNVSGFSSNGGVQVKIKSTPEKFWQAIVNSTRMFPTAMPALYTTIMPSNSDGSVRVITYGEDSPRIKQSEQQITEKYWPTFRYTILGGDILKYYANFCGEITVITTTDDGTWVKWTWEGVYPKPSNPVDIDVDLEELAVKTLGKLDEYLLRA
ncbi:MLP-like protein 423 [Mercurialis annua]|uniref:MLP-like protein 423 n=1 Tax=Mercurialis annua TaxID=3986 RepID=UPI00215F2833|nr:MLP-like protein 423 [Mercurialis annua]